MELVSALAHWRARTDAARAAGRRVAVVPTMGALHDGHRSLIARAAATGAFVVVTVFVNPLQFESPEDLRRYPESLDADRALSAAAGADLVVAPDASEMWPSSPAPPATVVHVRGLTDTYEGAGRPGHFDGVCTVVAKIFAVNGPGDAYFGEKDYQQLQVVRQMVADLALPVTVVGCPIVRDPDGLALSSRNGRLSPAGRARALGLSRAVRRAGARPVTAGAARAILADALADSGLVVHYADVATAELAPVRDGATGPARALVAASVDGVRLIDNGPVTLAGERD